MKSTHLKWMGVMPVLATLLGCAAVEEQVVTALMRNYVEAQEALAADDLNGAKEALGALLPEAEGELRDAVSKASKAEDLAQARASFKFISEKVSQTDLPEGYVVAYCPMADDGQGASWVQKKGNIRNPYFGKAMLECGEIRSDSR